MFDREGRVKPMGGVQQPASLAQPSNNAAAPQPLNLQDDDDDDDLDDIYA